MFWWFDLSLQYKIIGQGDDMTLNKTTIETNDVPEPSKQILNQISSSIMIKVVRWYSKWGHNMGPLPAILALCEGNLPVTCRYPSPRVCNAELCYVFYVSFHKLMDKRLICNWVETPCCVWRHCNIFILAPVGESNGMWYISGDMNTKKWNYHNGRVYRTDDQWCQNETDKSDVLPTIRWTTILRWQLKLWLALRSSLTFDVCYE